MYTANCMYDLIYNIYLNFTLLQLYSAKHYIHYIYTHTNPTSLSYPNPDPLQPPPWSADRSAYERSLASFLELNSNFIQQHEQGDASVQPAQNYSVQISNLSCIKQHRYKNCFVVSCLTEGICWIYNAIILYFRTIVNTTTTTVLFFCILSLLY